MPETAGVASVAFDEGGRWAELGGALPVLATPAGPVAAVARAGRGRVVLLADSEPLLNRGLPRADDAAFALAVAGERGRPVAFLETVHGYGEETGLAALPARALWVLAGLALAALALVWSMARPARTARGRGARARAAAARLRRGGRRRRWWRRATGAAWREAAARAARRRLEARAGLPAGAGEPALREAAARLGLDAAETDAVLGARRRRRPGRPAARSRG